MYEGTVAAAIRKMIYKPFGIILLKRFHECRRALLSCVKRFTYHGGVILGVFTGIGTRLEKVIYDVCTGVGKRFSH